MNDILSFLANNVQGSVPSFGSNNAKSSQKSSNDFGNVLTQAQKNSNKTTEQNATQGTEAKGKISKDEKPYVAHEISAEAEAAAAASQVTTTPSDTAPAEDAGATAPADLEAEVVPAVIDTNELANLLQNALTVDEPSQINILTVLEQFGIEVPADLSMDNMAALSEEVVKQINEILANPFNAEQNAKQMKILNADANGLSKTSGQPVQFLTAQDYARLSELGGRLEAALGKMQSGETPNLSVDIQSISVTKMVEEAPIVAAPVAPVVVETDIETAEPIEAADEDVPVVSASATEDTSENEETTSDSSEDTDDLAGKTALTMQANQNEPQIRAAGTDFARVADTQNVNPKAVVDQVVQAAALSRTTTGNTQMEIHLSPEFLGKISIVLTQTKDGLVAQIRTNGESAQHLLAGHMKELESGLKDMGLNMKKVEVTQSDNSWDMARNMSDQQTKQESTQERFTNHEQMMRMASLNRLNTNQATNEIAAVSHMIYNNASLRQTAANAYMGADTSVEFRALAPQFSFLNES